MRPDPNVEMLAERMQRQVKAKIKRMRKQARKRGAINRGHDGSKVPAVIRVEASKKKSKAAKQARRQHR